MKTGPTAVSSFRITAPRVLCVLLAGCFFFLSAPAPGAQDGKKAGPPSVLVAVATVEEGTIEPYQEFVGSVTFARVSDVSAEVAGIVEDAPFEEGARVRRGAPLVVLGTDLLDLTIESTEAGYEQVLSEHERAEKDLRRMGALYEEKTVPEMLYDEHRYGEQGLRKRAMALSATLKRLKREREKKTIRAPFDGVVVAKTAEVGEWVPVGGVIGVVADDRTVDVVVDVPERVLRNLSEGRTVDVESGGRKFQGKVFAIIPRGDTATRPL